jgi:predicted N-acyltransferase
LSLSSTWQTIEDYLNALRSNYRRRYRLACRKGASLTFRVAEAPSVFEPAHYALYAQVFHRSRIRVERLSLEYFRGCPDSTILTCEHNRRPVGFVQLIANGDELIFGFIGIDYAVNSVYDVYHNLMLRMVEYGIRQGFSSIDLGQTADDTKLKLGGFYEVLTAQLHHGNPYVNRIFRWVLPRLSYQPVTEEFRVFKSRGEAP